MKNRKIALISGMAIALCLLANQASATSFTVNDGNGPSILTVGGNAEGHGTATFGNLDPATFGGTGIPKDNTQITTIDNIVLGLSATQRYDNPALTNDGVGTFQALSGGDTTSSNPNAAYAKWNFDFYVSGIPNGATTKLYYGLDGSDVTQFVNLGGANIQDSWNLGMNFLSTAGFNPAVAGTYDFALVAYNYAGVELGYSATQVNSGVTDGGGGGSNNVPDGGSTVAMLGGVLGLFAFARRHMSGLLGSFSMSSIA